MKQKILIKHFSNLNNYGTGMMGLITIQSIVNNYDKDNVDIYIYFNNYTNINEILQELPQHINILPFNNNKKFNPPKNINKYLRKAINLLNVFFESNERKFDKIIVLGGDDFSEFYSRYGASIELFRLWRSSFYSKVFILGQTIGPFTHPLNKFAIKTFSKRLSIVARDKWTTDYLYTEFNLKIQTMPDIAFAPLPLQYRTDIQNDILNHYNLIKNNYVTIVVSGLVNEGYYCNDENIYLAHHKEIISYLLNKPEFENLQIALLAHTFPPYGNEAELINKLYNLINKDEKERITVINEKILPTRARFILGNGLFTITGRMHPAVSTYQMGKPAIVLSYSPKYKGVIGDTLNRSDLIIESNDPNKWISGTIVNLVCDKINYLYANYETITTEVKIISNKLEDINSNILKSL